MLASIVYLAITFAPAIRTIGPVVMITPDPAASSCAITIEDDWSGTLWITIDDRVFPVPGNWYTNVLYVDASACQAGATVEVTNESYVPLFVSGGAGAIAVSCGFAGNTIYCGRGDATVHGRSANLAFVVGHPKANTVTLYVEQAASSVILEYVNDSRTRYKVVGEPTAKWER